MKIRLKSVTSRPAQGGFSLMEALVSLLIISFLVVSLSAGIGYGFRNDQLVREDARATQLLNEKIDKLRLLNWEQLNDKDETPEKFYCAFNPEHADFGNEGETDLKGSGKTKNKPLIYTGKIKLSDGPKDVVYGTNMLEVKVTLEWTSATGMERSRSLTTYVAKYGIQNYAF